MSQSDHTRIGNPFSQQSPAQSTGHTITTMPRATTPVPGLLERAREEIRRQEAEAPMRKEAAMRALKNVAAKNAFRILQINTGEADWEQVDFPDGSVGAMLERDGCQFVFTHEQGLRVVNGSTLIPVASFNDFVEVVKAMDDAEALQREAEAELGG